MSGFLRRLSSFVLLCAMLAQAANSGPAASAQGTPDGSGCWPAGALTGIAGGEMMWSSAPQTIIDPAQQYQAKLQTTAGDILIQLDPVNAPIATNNFICLVLAGYYLGTDFHRIIANTLIQGGDPTGTGTGSPGYTIPSDPTMGSYPVGSVAMANSGPDQNGAQFFIAVSDLTMVIPGSYPVFGQVIGGMDIVAAISNAPATPNLAGEQSKPVEPNTILTVQVLTGTNSGVSQGPILSAPAPTPIVHAAPAVTPESTQATESTWGRPGGSASSDAPAVAPRRRGPLAREPYRRLSTMPTPMPWWPIPMHSSYC
ncbi:MAG: peptidylprolyl isomerase [Thermomicrobiales bacterium]|nr:peptidylprolyl isomerase [Thermomicrobiales bacterium]